MNEFLGTFKLSDNFTKYVGIDEIIFVLREGDKWASWSELTRYYNLEHNPNYDENIKNLLSIQISKL